MPGSHSKMSRKSDGDRDRSRSPTRAGTPAVPDGRACSLCGVLDAAPDVYQIFAFMVWGFPVKLILGIMRNQGNMCHPCFRVYHGRYWPRYQIKAMPTLLGSDIKERERFMFLRIFVVR